SPLVRSPPSIRRARNLAYRIAPPRAAAPVDLRYTRPVSDSVELKVFRDLAEIPRQSWDRVLEPDDNPFVSWTFLQALESSASAAPRRGWWPCHLTAWQDGELLAAAPAYVKNDSAGDFSRDWGLADSASRYGVSYYPKLVIGVPFSPVTGRRI